MSLTGFFVNSPLMENETLFFANDVGDRSARLLFQPVKIVSVRPANGDTPYVEGKDYRVAWDVGEIQLLPGSAIPSFNLLTDVLGSRQYKSLLRPGQPLLFGEGDFMHSKQVRVTYTHKGDEWKGKPCLPKAQPEKLPGITQKLRAKDACRVLLVGDSISVGYNASRLLKVPPHLPAYGEQVAQGLEKATGAPVTLVNISQAGMTAGWGLKQMPRLVASNPDLAIIAFGMNDAREGKSDKYEENLRHLIAGLRQQYPRVDVILVANMLSNPEFRAWPAHFENRQRLFKLAGEFERVVVADVMAVTEEILKRKKFADISGNNLNHPNDFLHRVYAEVVLGVILPEKRQ